MLVVMAVSSRNTKAVESSRRCCRNQRRRAQATSVRFCSLAYSVFFKGDLVTFVEAPNCGAAAGDPCLGHRRNDLIQCQIRPLRDQVQQKLHVILQRRYTATDWSCFNTSGRFPTLHPKHHGAWTKPKLFRNLTAGCARYDRFNHPFTQVQRIRLRHWPPKRIEMVGDSPILDSLGIPRDSRRTEIALINDVWTPIWS